MDYFPIIILMVAALLLAGGLIFLSHLLGPRRSTHQKTSPYECGIDPKGDARQHFSISFYLVAMLFILFDVEIIFLYPWAVVFLNMSPKLYAFFEMVIFIVILMAGYLYAWKKGAFEWD